MDGPIFGIKEVGSRTATRVEIVSDSAFRGWRGVVVRTRHSSYIEVRFPATERRPEITLGFGPSELKEIAS